MLRSQADFGVQRGESRHVQRVRTELGQAHKQNKRISGLLCHAKATLDADDRGLTG